MSVVYNPLSGNFETKEPGPQGPAGTVSAAGDGSEAAPSISFASDTNTGLFRHAENSIGVSTGGATRIIVNSSGNMLMGSSISMHPDADDINIAGPDNVGLTFRCPTNKQGAIYFADGVNGHDRQRGMIVYDHTDNSLRLHANVGERLRVDSTGRLGLGTSSPSVKLQIQDSSSTATRISSTDTQSFGQLQLQSSSQFLIGYGSTHATQPNEISLKNSVGDITFYTGGSERARLDSAGDLEIGGTLPSSPNITLGADGTGTFANGNVILKSSSGYSSVEIKNTTQRFTLGTDGGTNNFRVYNNTSSTTFSSWQTNGDFYHGGGTPNGSDISSPNIRLNADGSAVFDGKVETKSFVSVLGPTGGNSIQVRKAPYTSGDNTFVVKTDGSATFAGDIETTTAGDGVILKSPNGTRYRLTVANDGTLTTTAV